MRNGEVCFYTNIFPHFVLRGDTNVDPNEKVVIEVDILVDDADIIFYDFDAFDRAIDAHTYIEKIVSANASRFARDIPIGPDPLIFYFTGKREIFSVDTVLGKISASHNPSYSIGGPKGIHLKNEILTTIQFQEPCTFNEVIKHTLTLLRFLELLVGRPQNLLRLWLRIKSDSDNPSNIEVYWSMPPKRVTSSDDKERPHPCDVLVDAVKKPDVFGRILSDWLDRDQTWQDARSRFSNSFGQQKYTIDRLIGSANMFDILPSSAVPPDVQLSEELKSAREKCKEIFKKLPKSSERDSVLSTLGRIGKSNLKNKIRHRGQYLIDAVGESFLDLFTVTDEAVNCRNHYVHGSEPKIDYNSETSILLFFTDTLEFVFVASDLIEAGWDIKAWINTHTATMSHPFASYRINYAQNLQKLQSLLTNSKGP
jgi:hypothetical protein